MKMKKAQSNALKNALVVGLICIFIFSIQSSYADRKFEKIDKIDDINLTEYEMEKSYKVVNETDIFITALEEIKCEWRNPKDNFRYCTAFVELENKKTLDMTLKDTGFGLETKYPVTNVTYEVSNTYTNKDKKYVEEINDTHVKTYNKSKKEFTNFKTFDKNEKLKKNEPLMVEISFINPVVIEDGTYKDNFYNFTIIEESKTYKLDPDISACAELSSSDTYTMTADIFDATDKCIEITATDVIFDCAGFTIQSEIDNGVYITTTGVTVKNCNISLNGSGSDYGIYYSSGSDNGEINNNTIYVKANYGIYYSSVDSSSILNNKITADGLLTLLLSSSHYNLIDNNEIVSNSVTVRNDNSHDNNYTNNNITGTDFTFQFFNGNSDQLLLLNNNISGTDKVVTINSGGADNVIENNIITASAGIAISLAMVTDSNSFINNNLTATGNLIDDSGTNLNLIYNNSYGEVDWKKSNFDISTSGSLGLGNGINITNNSIYVDSTTFSDLNDSANLTFYGLTASESPTALRNDAACGALCSTPVNLTGGVIYFNVSSFTNYSLGNVTTYIVPNYLPTIDNQNSFINSTTAPSFNVTAGVEDTDGYADIVATNITVSSGTCNNVENTTEGNFFNSTWNCTGVALTESTITIGFTDAGDEYVQTTPSANGYPNNFPCDMIEDYTQTTDYECGNLSTNGYTWDTDGFDLNVTELAIINDSGYLDAGDSSLLRLGSITIEASSTYNASTVTDLTDEGLTGKAIDCDGTLTHNDGTFNISTATVTETDMQCTGHVYNLIIDTGDIGNEVRNANTVIIDNDLTVISGLFGSTSSKQVYQIDGDVQIQAGATFGRAETETITIGSLDIDSTGTYDATTQTTHITSESVGSFAIDCDGILTANGGEISIESDDDTSLDIGCAGNIYNFTINTANVIDLVGSSQVIDGNLNISEGTFWSDGTPASFTVTGDVIVEDGGLLGDGDGNTFGDVSFGSLQILSGGVYNATNGTTTLTNDSSGYILNAQGTLTHNNGTFVMSGATDGLWIDNVNNSFYDLDLVTTGIYYVKGNDLNITNDLSVGRPLYFAGSGTVGAYIYGDVTVPAWSALKGYHNSAYHANQITIGSLTVESSGEYSATNGTTTISGNFDNDGTFTHNDGTMTFNGTLDIQASGSVEPVFYDVIIAGANVEVKKNTTIINSVTSSASLSYWWTNHTFGNSTQSGTINVTAGSFRSIVGDTIFTGASQLYPVIVVGNEWSWGQNDKTWSLKWMDFQRAVTTTSSGETITLDGDCKFAAFTVSSGDTFDLNGQRAEFSGLLNINGIINTDDSLIYANRISMSSVSASNTWANSTVIITGATENDWSAGSDPNQNLFAENVVINSAGATSIKASNPQGFDGTGNKLTVASGTLTTTNNNFDITDMILANGGIIVAGSSNFDVSGDWQSSGGLIGKSALDLDGSEAVVIDDADNLDIANNITVGAWFKTTGSGTMNVVSKWSPWTMQLSSGNVIFKINSGGIDVTSSDTYNDDKWHYAVATYDTSLASDDMKLYVDGKLVDTTTNNNVITTGSTKVIIGSYDGGAGSPAGAYFNGEIGRVSIYNTALTESEIRSNMFAKCSEMSNQTELVSCYQFDTGTGTTVTDSIGSNTGTASHSTVWAAGGTFAEGTSTVNMTGNGSISYQHNLLEFSNLEVAQTGKTTTLTPLDSTGTDNMAVSGTLTTGDGTFTDGAIDVDLQIKGSVSPIIGSGTLANIYRIIYITGNADVTSTTYNHLYLQENRNLGGDVTVNSVFTINSDTLSSEGYNLNTETAYISGTLNLTAPSVLTFEDTAGAGFGTSSGTINLIGNTTSNVTITGGATNKWTINQSTMTAYLWKYAALSNGNSIGPENMVVLGWNVSGLEGFWDFVSPLITSNYFDIDNTTTHLRVSFPTMYINFTAEDETVLDSMNYTIVYQNGTTMNSTELDVRGNMSFTWADGVNVTDYPDGDYNLTLMAWDTHNELQEKDKYKKEEMKLVMEDGTHNHGNSKKDYNSNNIIVMQNNEYKYEVEVADGTKVKTTIKDVDDYSKIDYRIKTNKDGEVKFIINDMELVENSPFGNAHFITPDKMYYFDFYEAELKQGIDIEVKEIDTNKYLITLTHDNWKKNEWVDIDPSAGAVNKNKVDLTFEIISNVPEILTVSPIDGTVFTPSTGEWTYNITTHTESTCYYSTSAMTNVTDGTIMSSTGDIEHTNLMTGFVSGERYCFYFQCNNTVGDGVSVGPYCVQVSTGASTSGTGGSSGSPTILDLDPTAPLIVTDVQQPFIIEQMSGVSTQLTENLNDIVVYFKTNALMVIIILISISLMTVLVGSIGRKIRE